MCVQASCERESSRAATTATYITSTSRHIHTRSTDYSVCLPVTRLSNVYLCSKNRKLKMKTSYAAPELTKHDKETLNIFSVRDRRRQATKNGYSTSRRLISCTRVAVFSTLACNKYFINMIYTTDGYNGEIFTRHVLYRIRKSSMKNTFCFIRNCYPKMTWK